MELVSSGWREENFARILELQQAEKEKLRQRAVEYGAAVAKPSADARRARRNAHRLRTWTGARA